MKTIKSQGVRRLSIALIFLTALLFMSGASLAAPTDIEGHWAENTIARWIDEGSVKGYEDGTFKPNNPITRAEFMVLVNNAFGFSKTAELDFTDVAADAWYASHVAKAKAGVYISGYPDGTVRPGANITRQEVAVVIANLKNLADNEKAVARFNDANLVPDWSKGAIGAVLDAGYMSGYPDGTFKPTNNITRAEALVALDNLPNTVVYDQAGTYGPAKGEEAVNADVIINEDGVVFQNLLIAGDLTIGEGVGTGTVTLNNITVKGETYVRGGGTDSIVINGGSFNKITILKTSSGAVRIVATDAKGMDIVLAEEADGDTVVLEGAFDSVTVDASEVVLEARDKTAIKNIVINAPQVVLQTKGKAKIESITVTEKSKDIVLNLDKETTVTKLVKNEGVKVTVKGEGKVVETVVEKDDKTTEEKPKKETGGGTTDPGGTDDPAPSITVTNIKIYDTGGNVIGSGKDLTGVDVSTRVSKITFKVNTAPSTLTITGVNSDKGSIGVTPSKVIELPNKDCTVTVDDLLNIGQGSVSIKTLLDAFGTQVSVQGKITATNYNSYTTPITIILADSMVHVPENKWATLAWTNEHELTATLKSNMKDVSLVSIGVAGFLNEAFSQLPTWVKIGDSEIGVVLDQYDTIKSALLNLVGKTEWPDVNLSDLAGKSIGFKIAASSQVYTLKIVE